MFWKKKYKISDLLEVQNKIKPIRDKYRIAVIDDQNISLIKRLKKHNYRIDHFKDIMNIDELNRFDIIICDIEGVGKNFGSTYEGGHLISEISNSYPLKYLIAFSGKSFNVTYNRFFSLCDNVMHKHADISEWTGCIDKAIKNLSDPIYVWQKSRKTLIGNKENLNEVSNLEQAYLKSILKNDKSHWDKVSSKNNFDYGNSVATIDALGTYISIVLQLIAN